MELSVPEFIEVLSRKARLMECDLSLRNFPSHAVQELNMSVREFWANYKVYLVGAFGHDVGLLEKFQDTKMGRIVTAYGRFYGKKVVYEAVVRDVLMGLESFYLEEYGKDISNLQVLVTQFEDAIAFKENEHGAIIFKLIQEEECGKESKTLTKWMNNHPSSTLDTIIATPMKYDTKRTSDSYGKKEEDRERPKIMKKSMFENGPLSQGMDLAALEERKECLKKRQQKLRRLRKDSKPDKVDQKPYVETNVYRIPNGKGRRELRLFLSLVTLSTIPTGIVESKNILTKTIDGIVNEARNEFKGDWSDDWAKEAVRATIRQRKSKTMKQVKDREQKQELQSSLTTDRFKSILKASKNPTFVHTSGRLKETRALVTKVSHAGRGGFPHIRIRYFQEHNEVPSAEKVREIANTVAERKMEVE